MVVSLASTQVHKKKVLLRISSAFSKKLTVNSMSVEALPLTPELKVPRNISVPVLTTPKNITTELATSRARPLLSLESPALTPLDNESVNDSTKKSTTKKPLLNPCLSTASIVAVLHRCPSAVLNQDSALEVPNAPRLPPWSLRACIARDRPLNAVRAQLAEEWRYARLSMKRRSQLTWCLLNKLRKFMRTKFKRKGKMMKQLRLTLMLKLLNPNWILFPSKFKFQNICFCRANKHSAITKTYIQTLEK